MNQLNDDIGESIRLELWKQLLTLRLVEKKAYDLFLQNRLAIACTYVLKSAHTYVRVYVCTNVRTYVRTYVCNYF